MITIDCADPKRLSGFWTQVLGVEVAADYGEFLYLNPQKEGGVRLGFQKVPEPRAGKNRLHLDLGAADRAAEVARLTGLGATQVAEHSAPGLNWTVLADMEGNQFCVAQSG